MGGLFSSNKYTPKYNPNNYNKQRPGKNVYNIDTNNVYWRGEKVNGANGITFVDYDYGYGKDDRHVFYKSNIIYESDVKSFNSLINKYAKDEKNVYYEGKVLPNSDVKTFKTNNDGTSIDKNFKYKNGTKIARRISKVKTPRVKTRRKSRKP